MDLITTSINPLKPSTTHITLSIEETASLKNNESQEKPATSQTRETILLISYCFIVGLTGSFLTSSWYTVQQLFLQAGAFNYLCDNSEAVLNDGVLEQVTGRFYCHEQITAVNAFMPTAAASSFVFALVGGWSVDFLGPKLTGTMGLSLVLAGWITLFFANNQTPVYSTAIMLMGFGSEPTLMALLTIFRLFDNYSPLILCAIIGSRSLNDGLFGLSTWLMQKGWPLSAISFFFCLMLSFSLVLVSITLPWRIDAGKKVVTDQSTVVSKTPPTTSVATLSKKGTSGVATSWGSLPSASLASTNCSLGVHGSLGSTNPLKLGYGLRDSRALPAKNLDCFQSFELSSASTQYGSIGFCSSFINKELVPVVESGENKQSRNILSFQQSEQYLPLFPLAAATILCRTFLSISASHQFGSAFQFSVAIAPFGIVASFICGYLMVKWSIIKTMVIVNIANSILFVLLISKGFLPVLFLYCCIVLDWLTSAVFLSQFYCYILAKFSYKYFGRLVGTVIMFSGLISLVSTPMCDFSSVEGSFRPMNCLCLGVTIINFVFLRFIRKND